MVAVSVAPATSANSVSGVSVTFPERTQANFNSAVGFVSEGFVRDGQRKLLGGRAHDVMQPELD
ncbi:hypothetical protein GCM10009000_099890 [Halobacterium noricense]